MLQYSGMKHYATFAPIPICFVLTIRMLTLTTWNAQQFQCTGFYLHSGNKSLFDSIKFYTVTRWSFNGVPKTTMPKFSNNLRLRPDDNLRFTSSLEEMPARSTTPLKNLPFVTSQRLQTPPLGSETTPPYRCWLRPAACRSLTEIWVLATNSGLNMLSVKGSN